MLLVFTMDDKLHGYKTTKERYSYNSRLNKENKLVKLSQQKIYLLRRHGKPPPLISSRESSGRRRE